MPFRRFFLLTALLLAATLAARPASAQIALISDFTLKKADDGALTLASLASRKAVVVVYTNPACPFAKLYQARLSTLAGSYAAQGVEFLLVSAPLNLEQTAENLEVDKLKVKTSSSEQSLLTDEGLQTAALLGVTKAPEAVLLQPVPGGFTIRYRGAIDDNPQMEAHVKERHLKSALDAVLAGQTAAIAEKRASGCLIKRN